MSDRPRIDVDGMVFEWDRENGQMLVRGERITCMWTKTTMAGLMSGLRKMAGTERYSLAIEQAGRASIEGEWDHITGHPTFEEGFRSIGHAAGIVGLGLWELVHLDREKNEARFRVRNDWESLCQKALGESWGSGTLAGKFGGYCSRLFKTYCRAKQVKFAARGDDYDEFFVAPASLTIEQEIDVLLMSEAATQADLQAALERLRQEVEERRRIEDDLRAQMDMVKRQERAIQAMETPILRLWSGVLTMPVIGIVDSTRAGRMMSDLLEQITRTQARFTILDLTGVEIIDTGAASHLLSLVRAAGLLGTKCLISGISPAMASTIIGLGLNLDEIQSFASLEAALRYAIRQNR